jgi:hypothetical protein
MSGAGQISLCLPTSANESEDPAVLFASEIWKDRFPGFDASVFARAETVLVDLSSRFDEWLGDEVARLAAAGDCLKSDGGRAETAERLYLHAHTLKGLGCTYNYPVVTRLAASLCRLIEDCGFQAGAAAGLIHAHVEAIQGVVRDAVHDQECVLVNAVVEDLEGQIRRLEQRLRATA